MAILLGPEPGVAVKPDRGKHPGIGRDLSIMRDGVSNISFGVANPAHHRPTCGVELYCNCAGSDTKCDFECTSVPTPTVLRERRTNGGHDIGRNNAEYRGKDVWGDVHGDVIGRITKNNRPELRQIRADRTIMCWYF